MTTTASLEQSLQAVESQLPKLEKAAEAEIAFMLYNSAESNPWAGGCKRRDDLRQEVRDLRLQIKAIERKSVLSKFREIEKELEETAARRLVADNAAGDLSENPVVRSWQAAV